MGTPAKTYNLARVIVTLDGVRVTGFGPDAAIEFERPGDVIEDEVGADGQVVASVSNDFRMYATITLQETSLACKTLLAKYQAQAALSVITPMSFIMHDTVTGDRVTDQYAIFKKLPAPNKGKKAGTRQFVLLLPNAGSSALLANLQTI